MQGDDSAGSSKGEPIGGYSHVSTRGLNASARIELWERHNAKVLFELSARSLDGRPFDAVERALKLPEITLAHVSASSHILERNQQHIALGGAEGVMIFLSLAGDAFFHHSNGNHSQRPGTLLVCDGNRPFLRGFANGLQEYVATVPRGIFETATGLATPREPAVMSFAGSGGGNPHASALAALIRQSLSGPEPGGGPEIEQRLLALMGAMFAPGSEGSAEARRQAALAWIRRHLGDASLSVGTVARGIGVSERSLTRAFAETGQGVARTILEMRLTAAHRQLTSAGAPQVHEVAHRCGFVSAAHFSRVFRDHYGVTPTQARATS